MSAKSYIVLSSFFSDHLDRKLALYNAGKNPLSGCTLDSNNCLASPQEAEEHSVSADTHDLNNCFAWSQAVLSKRKNKDTHCSSRHCVAQERALQRSTATKRRRHSMSARRTQTIAALHHRRLKASTKKKAQAITVSAEKQREHNVRTHRLRVEDSCCSAKQANKCSEREHLV